MPDEKELARVAGDALVGGSLTAASASGELQCSGPFSDAHDCPVHRPTDIERYDHATVVHLKEREREYQRTLWALAAAAWPNPLRVSLMFRNAWTYQSELQTRTDHQTDELLIYAPPPNRASRPLT